MAIRMEHLAPLSTARFALKPHLSKMHRSKSSRIMIYLSFAERSQALQMKILLTEQFQELADTIPTMKCIIEQSNV